MSFRSLKNEPETRNEPNNEKVLVYNAKKSTFEENTTVQRVPGRGRNSSLSPPGGVEVSDFE